MRGVPPVVETLAGIALAGVAVSQLVAGARTFPSFGETLVMLVLLLVGIALIYLGFERRRDARDAGGHGGHRDGGRHAGSGRASAEGRTSGHARHDQDDERW